MRPARDSWVNPALALVLCALAGAAFAWLRIPLPWMTMILAMAPGGIAEMCITAKVLQLSVPLVTAAHVVRVLVLILTTGPVFRAAHVLQVRLRNR